MKLWLISGSLDMDVVVLSDYEPDPYEMKRCLVEEQGNRCDDNWYFTKPVEISQLSDVPTDWHSGVPYEGQMDDPDESAELYELSVEDILKVWQAEAKEKRLAAEAEARQGKLFDE